MSNFNVMMRICLSTWAMFLKKYGLGRLLIKRWASNSAKVSIFAKTPLGAI